MTDDLKLTGDERRLILARLWWLGKSRAQKGNQA